MACAVARPWASSANVFGCGKTVTALSILRLVADPPGRIVSGAIRFAGPDLLKM